MLLLRTLSRLKMGVIAFAFPWFLSHFQATKNIAVNLNPWKLQTFSSAELLSTHVVSLQDPGLLSPHTCSVYVRRYVFSVIFSHCLLFLV